MPLTSDLSKTQVQSISKLLSKSETRNLGTTFVDFVPAPGSNKAIIPLFATFNFVGGTTPFDFWQKQASANVFVVYSVTVTTLAGNFQLNEYATGGTSGKTMYIRAGTGVHVLPTIVQVNSGLWTNGEVITGHTSGATGTVTVAPVTLSGSFTVGETLTGTTSTATAVLLDTNGGSPALPLHVRTPSNPSTFGNGEILTGGTSGKKCWSAAVFQTADYGGDIQILYSPGTTPWISSQPHYDFGSGVAGTTSLFHPAGIIAGFNAVHANTKLIIATSGGVNWASGDSDTYGDSQVQVDMMYMIVNANANFDD